MASESLRYIVIIDAQYIIPLIGPGGQCSPRHPMYVSLNATNEQLVVFCDVFWISSGCGVF